MKSLKRMALALYATASIAGVFAAELKGDGKDLVMTHYCMLQNQPKMKLDPKSTATKLNFEFIGGANIDPAKDMHMHNGSITIVDENTIEWTWCAWSGGKADDGHKVNMKLVRKK